MIEFRLYCEDDEYVLGEFSSADILPLVKTLRSSEVLDEEGKLWQAEKLYFNISPPYFYMSLDNSK